MDRFGAHQCDPALAEALRELRGLHVIPHNFARMHCVNSGGANRVSHDADRSPDVPQTGILQPSLVTNLY